MGKLDRGRVVRRDDHPHTDPRLVEQLLRKVVGHPHAAVRGRIPGQRPAVQRDAVPGDALHVRHPGIVIEGRVVVLVLLDDGEDASRRLASCGAGRHRRAQDPSVGVVESDLLSLDRHDRHDRLACLARRRLAGWRGSHLRLARWRGSRLSRRGVGGQWGQCGHRRERHNGGNVPTPRRHGGLRRHEAIYHAMSRACRRLPSIRSATSLFKSPDTALGRIYEHTAQLRRAYRRRSKLCTSNADLFLPLLSVGLAARSGSTKFLCIPECLNRRPMETRAPGFLNLLARRVRGTAFASISVVWCDSISRAVGAG